MDDCHKCMFCAENEYDLLRGDSWYCHKIGNTLYRDKLSVNFTCGYYREASNRKEEP